MAHLHCTKEDVEIIAGSLKAAVEGPFFPDWEFSTLFGLDRAEVAEIARAWPKVDESDRRVDLAVNNALGNLAGYPHGHEQDWDRFLAVPPERLLEVLKRWRLSHGASPERPSARYRRAIADCRLSDDDTAAHQAALGLGAPEPSRLQSVSRARAPMVHRGRNTTSGTAVANSLTALGADEITVGTALNATGVTYDVWAITTGTIPPQ